MIVSIVLATMAFTIVAAEQPVISVDECPYSREIDPNMTCTDEELELAKEFSTEAEEVDGTRGWGIGWPQPSYTPPEFEGFHYVRAGQIPSYKNVYEKRGWPFSRWPIVILNCNAGKRAELASQGYGITYEKRRTFFFGTVESCRIFKQRHFQTFLDQENDVWGGWLSALFYGRYLNYIPCYPKFEEQDSQEAFEAKMEKLCPANVPVYNAPRSRAPDFTGSARVCGGRKTKTKWLSKLRESLGNHLFYSQSPRQRCDAWCVGDATEGSKRFFVWNRRNECWKVKRRGSKSKCKLNSQEFNSIGKRKDFCAAGPR